MTENKPRLITKPLKGKYGNPYHITHKTGIQKAFHFDKDIRSAVEWLLEQMSYVCNCEICSEHKALVREAFEDVVK